MPRKGHEQADGPLKGYFKVGRTYRPPLLAYTETQLVDWARDGFPDLLWPAVVVTLHGDESSALFRHMQGAVVARFGKEAVKENGLNFDTRLSSLNDVDVGVRRDVLELFRSEQLGPAIPDELVAILRRYPAAPGAWLLLDPWPERGTEVAADAALTLVARAFADSQTDSHRKALMQLPALEWRAVCGNISVPRELAAQMAGYPNDPATVGAADAFIRGASVMDLGEVSGPPRIVARDWARAFWNWNWSMTDCLPAERRDADANEEDDEVAAPAAMVPEAIAAPSADATTEDGSEGEDTGPTDLETEAHRLTDRVGVLLNAFLVVALDHSRTVDLYAPASHEVVCGLISRAARAVLAASLSPDTWSGEHGASVIRLLAETEIVVTWLGSQDAEAYVRYQAYGQGKGKLAHVHMRALIDSFDGDAPDYLVAAVERLGRQFGDDRGQEFIEVNVSSTFSGRSVRDMAADVGLDELYRFAYQPASSVTHGEWWTIEDFAMQRCLNPLHRGHLIPSFDGLASTTLEFGRMLADRLEDLMGLALRILFPEEGPPADERDAPPVDS
jgi:hypothetical protein